jgi:peptidyl-prolyl cis-trans isomerase B (cyclophilin B)
MNKNRLLIWLFFLAVAAPMMGQEQQVMLETTEGDILLTLYDDTPRHRDNFLRLVGEHFYDSLLFHRVIKSFMIQSGDPTSRYAEQGTTLGEGENGYTIEPELFAADGRLLHHHQRGALAMAREGDDVNPERRSSGCQFYIVWGKTFSSNDLLTIGERLDSMTQHRVAMDSEMMTLYRKTGGTPHLDGQYTVFGEVAAGLDVVKRIQQAFIDDYDRPVDDVRILRARILQKESSSISVKK